MVISYDRNPLKSPTLEDFWRVTCHLVVLELSHRKEIKGRESINKGVKVPVSHSLFKRQYDIPISRRYLATVAWYLPCESVQCE